MSSRKQSKRARFAEVARRERASNRQIRRWLTLDVLERGAAMIDAAHLEPLRLIGFDLGEPGGDRCVVMWGRREGKATLIEAIKEYECKAPT